jgi:hypothetical protein
VGYFETRSIWTGGMTAILATEAASSCYVIRLFLLKETTKNFIFHTKRWVGMKGVG